jgi:hypothetical protein
MRRYKSVSKCLAATSPNDYIHRLYPIYGATNMNNHLDFRVPVCASEMSNTSCLTINEPGSSLGLCNLLDVVSHEISQEGGKQIHRLTFKSGQTLYVKADPCAITIRGSRINFNSNSKFPSTTFLSDPAIPGSVESCDKVGIKSQ